jgi:putative phosphoesterase
MSEMQKDLVKNSDHPLQIAVISDTHNFLPQSVEAAIAGADEIWHLGDVCRGDILDRVRKLGPPVIVVRGNNDSQQTWPLEICLTRSGITFRLIHIPPSLSNLGKTDILLHGHTHVPRDEIINGVRILNPGAIGKANKGAPPSYAWLEIGPHGTINWRVLPP